MTEQENQRPNDHQQHDHNRPEADAAQDQGAPGAGEPSDAMS
jgi:hypothetical protein